MALVKCHKTVYDPTFDENTGKYVDISPYKKHERNRITNLQIETYFFLKCLFLALICMLPHWVSLNCVWRRCPLIRRVKIEIIFYLLPKYIKITS